MDTFRGDPCGVENCRSTRFHVADDGRTYCHRGHQKEGEVLTQLEGYGPGGSQGPGAAKKSRKKTTVERTAGPVTLEGGDAIELYLQCFQLVLRKQIAWLIRNKQYADELEAVVQELWVLRIQMLRDMMQDQDGPASLNMFSTQSDTEVSEDDRSRRRSARARFQIRVPRLIESIGLLYVAHVVMRLPICYSDVRKWTLHEDFPFLRAINELPTEMTQTLRREMVQTFQPTAGLGTLETLHATTQDVATAFDRSFGLDMPQINSKLLLFRFISELSLPLDVFAAVHRLVDLLDLHFYLATRRRYTNLSDHPEIRLMSLMVVAVKLLYPFDDNPRYPRTTTEPAALVMDWTSWNQVRARSADRSYTDHRGGHETYHKVTEHDVMSMTASEMDGYLNWFGKTWTDKEPPKGRDADFREALMQMFPVDDYSGLEELQAVESDLSHDAKERLERLRSAQSTLIVRRPVPDEDATRGLGDAPLRPGGQYKHYRVAEDLSERAKPFLTAAADIIGLPLSSLLVAVFQLEMKLQRWIQHERRRNDPTADDDIMNI